MHTSRLALVALAIGLTSLPLCAQDKEPAAPPVENHPQLKRRQEQLALENSIAEQELKKGLAEIAARKQRLELENAVREQELAAELAKLRSDITHLESQAKLVTGKLALEQAEQKARLEKELLDLRSRIEKAKAQEELANLEIGAQNRELEHQKRTYAIRLSELQVEQKEFEIELAKLNAEIDLREKRDIWRNRVNREIQYTAKPYQDGVLTISDRRIALNGLIGYEMADHIAERIDYFNNQDREMPIFIVIDRSPGGSVMAGYKILKAMQGSPAPVKVIVKSFAASMAAGITTLAEESYAYPNAILLHHQILSGSYGNLTEQRERLEELEEWWRRLAAPIAKKMGISLEEFIKQMYANRSSGDWEVFGDRARELKWVDNIVETIREESYVRNPDTRPDDPGQAPHRKGTIGSSSTEAVDAQGRQFIRLPRLDPVDCYYLYNPDGYYRLTR